MIPYSLLDLAPVPEGSSVSQALANVADLARHAEALGYQRFWLAEHHNMRGIASAATAVLIGHAAAATRHIRLGAGGVMLPNWAPLQVAEAFGTLAELFPGRIDLGLGRAPGTDGVTMQALRRGMSPEDRFPQDVVELMEYFAKPAVGAPDPAVIAVPGIGTEVPIWILGSSLYGAQLAAYLGLPYAFASHFAPAALSQAADVYRRSFRPSARLGKPHFMMAVNVFGAETREKAQWLRSSMVQAFANLRLGRPGPLPAPRADVEASLPPQILAGVNQALSVTVVGDRDDLARGLADLIAAYEPDELILTGQIHDHGARKASFALAAEALAELPQPA